MSRGETSLSHRSSMESFLDVYQYVRLWLSGIGTLLVVLVSLISGWGENFTFVLLILVAVGAHSAWTLRRGVRTPVPMLFFDLTLWGIVLVLNNHVPEINSAMFAFLSILPLLFASTYWRAAAFLGYLSGWFGTSYFLNTPPTTDSVGIFLSILVTVAALGAVIVQIRKWLGRLDANRSQMLGTVSHELKNNLTGMLGMTELVTTQRDIAPEEAMELIELAHQQARDATEIVEDLLTVSRLEGATLALENRQVDLDQEVATTAHRFDGEGATITVSTGGDLPLIEADPLRVRQIIRNLISNAVRYGGEEIEVVTRARGSFAEVLVRDDGDGIPSEDEATIFLPYRRSSRTPATGASVGLGLWVSRQLAEAMEGSLTYERSTGWTEFSLRFTSRPVPPVSRDPIDSAAGKDNPFSSPATTPGLGSSG